MKKIITLCIVLLAFSSCDNFTDLDLPTDQITKDMVFKDLNLANSAMSNVYRSLETSGFLSGNSDGAGVLLACYTDELKSYSNSLDDYSRFYSLTHNASNYNIKTLWGKTYNQIYSVNAIIEGLEASTHLESEGKNRLRGEALFVRALLHLYLTNTFGDIPYITTTNYEINNKVVRDTQTVVFTNIKNDLDEALKYLPETAAVGNRVKPTKIAAYAILARLSYYQHKCWL